ncbi:hypothetical protein T492DRAFT_837193 [Pavlovales sp. CCMP2436]|nr:hypothetical protein T492DRAFT_837193 [Pavlovales sp. CCMP2436]
MALSMAALQRALPGERREALLVGINAYNSSPLRNCVNDATDVATSLRRLGFRTLIETDCSLDVFENAIAIFQEWLKPGTVNRNYLIPRDWACGTVDTSLRRRAIDAQEVLDGMRARGSGFNIVSLDACRSYAGLARSTKDLADGLATMIPPDMRDGGSLIAYATAVGDTALDGYGRGGRNGLYDSGIHRLIDQYASLSRPYAASALLNSSQMPQFRAGHVNRLISAGKAVRVV